MNDEDRIIREKERHKITGVPRSTWRKYEQLGEVPKAIPLLGDTKGWRLSEIKAWIVSREQNLTREPEQTAAA